MTVFSRGLSRLFFLKKRIVNLIIWSGLIVGLLAWNTESTFSMEKWVRLTTDHFTFVGNSSPARIQKLAVQLDQFMDLHQIITPSFRLVPPLPVVVYVFNDSTDIRLISPRRNGKYLEFAGFFNAGLDSYNLVLHTPRESIDSVVYHELEHAVIHDNVGKWPLCLNEGFAEFMSTFHVLDNGAKIKIGGPIPYHLATLQSQGLISLKILFEVDHSSPHYNDSDKKYRFYAESWALVHYPLLGNQQKRAQQFNNFLQLIDRDIPAEESFQKAFGTTFKEIEKELFSYINLLGLPELTYHSNSIKKSNVRPDYEPLAEADIHRYSGDLLVNIHSYQKAKEQLELAMQGKTSQGLIHAALGNICLMQARWEEADEQTSKALEYQPEEYRVQLMRGIALTQIGKYEMGLKHLAEASRLHPDVHIPYIFFYSTNLLAFDQKAGFVPVGGYGRSFRTIPA